MASLSYRRDIDVLRAIAVAGVVIWHAGLGMPGGFLGVDMFFVISGYLMARIWEGSPRLGDFLVRRTRRIIPAMLAIIAVTLGLGAILMPPSAWQALLPDALWSSLGVPNIAYALQDSYWSEPAKLRPLLHLWTLGVELQFYILCALIFAGTEAFRSARKALWWMLTAASLALAFYLARTMADLAFYTLHTRLWEFGAGVLVALHFGKGASASPRTRLGLWTLGVAIASSSLFWSNPSHPHPGWVTLAPVLGTALALAAGPLPPADRNPLWRALAALGLLSYSLYLVHQPVFVFARLQLGQIDLPPGLALVLVAVSILLAMILYICVETPMRRRRNGLDWVPLALVPLVSAVLLVMPTAVAPEDGRAERNMPDPSDLAPPRAIAEVAGRVCANSTLDTPCVLGAADVVPTVALLGDSHLQAMTALMAEALAEKGLAAVDLTIPGCPFIRGIERYAHVGGRRPCGVRVGEAFDQLRARGLTRAIILDRRSAYLLGEGALSAEGDREPGDFRLFAVDLGPDAAPDVQAARIAELHLQTWRDLEALGVDSVWILPLPEMGVHVPDAATAALEQGDPPPVLPLSLHRGRQRVLSEARDLAGRLGVTIIDPVPAFCQDDTCHSHAGRHLLYTDRDHPSVYGSRRLLDMFEDDIFGSN